MKMNLEKTWSECLRMWRWIAETKTKETRWGIFSPVSRLKVTWLECNNYIDNDKDLLNECFFCNYADTHRGQVEPGECENCPAQTVDETFNCCGYPSFNNKPVEFYELLVELNKKRLSKKGKR